MSAGLYKSYEKLTCYVKFVNDICSLSIALNVTKPGLSMKLVCLGYLVRQMAAMPSQGCHA